jgi:prepilin-type N-terminal cleavage/methylation domain-containing protein
MVRKAVSVKMPTLSTGSNKQESGFTLIELMVVAAVLLSVGMALAPSIGGFLRSKEISGAVRGVISSVSLAREMAIDGAASHELSYNSSSKSLTVKSVPDEEEDDDDESDETAKIQYRYVIPRGVELRYNDEDDWTMTFAPDGSCDGGELVLSDANGQERTVSVDPVLGRAELKSDDEDEGVESRE